MENKKTFVSGVDATVDAVCLNIALNAILKDEENDDEVKNKILEDSALRVMEDFNAEEMNQFEVVLSCTHLDNAGCFFEGLNRFVKNPYLKAWKFGDFIGEVGCENDYLRSLSLLELFMSFKNDIEVDKEIDSIFAK